MRSVRSGDGARHAHVHPIPPGLGISGNSYEYFYDFTTLRIDMFFDHSPSPDELQMVL